MRKFYSMEQYYSAESLERFAKMDAFFVKHSHVTKKMYKVNDLYIRCIAYEYDKCLNRENSYGVQVWETETMTNPENCIMNQWFPDKTPANDFFKIAVAMAKV